MKKMIKTYRSLLLIAVMLISVLLTACEPKKDDQTSGSATVSFSVVEAEEGGEDGTEATAQNSETQSDDKETESTEATDDSGNKDQEAEPENQTTEHVAEPEVQTTEPESEQEYVRYYFRNKKLLNSHYEKHGIEMGFADEKAYEAAASDVINNPEALHKVEKEDGDYVYYVEATNEFVVLSKDRYIRTYFLPSAGIKYYNRQ